MDFLTGKRRFLQSSASLLSMGVALALMHSATALAGSMPLAWNPVEDYDLAGYYVYYGTSSGEYQTVLNVGNVTTYPLNGLDDCTRYYVAVKAHDLAGNRSESFSNEVAGLPTPVVSSVSAAYAERGQSLTVSVTGASFDNGAKVSFSDPTITVHSSTYVSCTQVDAVISIATDASIGWNAVSVINPDQSFGTLEAAFEVGPFALPTVLKTSPADGATGVPIGANPTVTFSEEMNANFITDETVGLLLPDGTEVLQAAGSPILDETGTVATIVPARALAEYSLYRIAVLHGPSGLQDRAGFSMGAPFIQDPGFRTVGSMIIKERGEVLLRPSSCEYDLDYADVHFEAGELTESSVIELVMFGHNEANNGVSIRFDYLDVPSPAQTSEGEYFLGRPGAPHRMKAEFFQSTADSTRICDTHTTVGNDLIAGAGAGAGCSTSTAESVVFASDWTLRINLRYEHPDLCPADRETRYRYYLRVIR